MLLGILVLLSALSISAVDAGYGKLKDANAEFDSDVPSGRTNATAPEVGVQGHRFWFEVEFKTDGGARANRLRLQKWRNGRWENIYVKGRHSRWKT